MCCSAKVDLTFYVCIVSNKVQSKVSRTFLSNEETNVQLSEHLLMFVYLSPCHHHMIIYVVCKRTPQCLNRRNYATCVPCILIEVYMLYMNRLLCSAAMYFHKHLCLGYIGVLNGLLLFNFN